VRYERSSQGVESSPRARPTRRLVVAGSAVVLAGAALGGLLVSASPSGSRPVASATSHGLENVVLEALVVQDDLGAPTPPGVTGASWALHSLPARPRGVISSFAIPTYQWVRSGAVQLLDRKSGAALLAADRRDVALVAAGSLRSQFDSQLASIVQGEERSSASLSAPGGARLVRWYSVAVHGDRATVDGMLENWDEQVTVTGSAGHRRLRSSIQWSEIEALASLQRTSAGWRVTSLDEKPFQQAT
jgi:hypothetical protein